MAAGEFLLKFVADASQPMLVMDQIKAKAKETQAEIVSSSAGAAPVQRVNALANERGRLIGDVTSAQEAGILSGTQSKNLKAQITRDFQKGFQAIIAEMGIAPGTPAHEDLKRTFKDTAAAATTRRVKENAGAVSSYNKNKESQQRAEEAAQKKAAEAKAAASKAEQEKAKRQEERAKKEEQAAKKDEEAAKKPSGGKYKSVSASEVFGEDGERLSPEQEAKLAAKDRETAVRYGAAKQAAYLKQIQDDPEFAKKLSAERFDRSKRLAIEDANYNKRVRDDFTSNKADSFLAKSAQAKADEITNASAVNAMVKRRLSEDSLYLETQKEGALAEAQLTALKKQALVTETEYINSKVAASVADAQMAAKVSEALAANNDYIGAKVTSAVAHAKEAEALAVQKAANDELVASMVATTVANQKISAKQAEALAANDQYQASLVDAAVTEKTSSAARKAAIAERLAKDTGYAGSNARARIAKDVSTVTDIEEFRKLGGVAQAVEAKVEQARLDQEINAGKWIELSTNEQAIKAKAETIIAEKAYKDAVEAQVLLMAGGGRKKFLGGLLGGGSGGSGGAGSFLGPDESGAEFFGTGLRSTIRHVLPSLALFAIGGEIVKTVKQASELERIFNQIEDQFKAVDDAASFPNFKKSVLEISKETGVASDTLATIAFQYKGAFGAQGNDYVLRQTQSAAQIAKVTGLNPTETVDSVQAASISFGVDAQRLGNIALNIQDRYGVLAKETIKFLGDVAPAAQDAGFSLEEISTLAGIAQQRSGRAGSAIAESFNRIFPAMREVKAQLLELATSNKALKSPEFIKDLVDGNVAQQFIFLAQNFDKLDERAQGFIVKLLGGRREAQAILPIFAAGDIKNQIKDTKNADKNLLEDRFNKLQETLQQRIAQLSETFKQFGVSLFESGLGDFLKDLAGIAKVVVDVFAGVAKIFNLVNKATGGMAGHIMAIYLALRLLIALKSASLVQSAFGMLLPGAAGAGTAAGGGVPGVTGALLATRAGAAFAAASNAGAGTLSALGAGAGAAITSPLGIAIGAAMAYAERQRQHAQAEAARTEYSKMKDSELQAAYANESSRNNSNFGSISRFLSGDPQNSTLAQDELQRRDANSVGISQAKTLLKTLTVDQRKEIGKSLQPYVRDRFNEYLKAYIKDPTNDRLNEHFNDIVNAAYNLQGKNELSPQQIKGLTDNYRKKSKKINIQEIINQSDTKYQDYDQIKASYQTGQISIDKIKENLDGRIKLLKSALATYPGDLDLKNELAKYTKERYDIIGQALDSKFELDTKLIDVFGGSDRSKALQKIALLQQRLQTPGLDPQRRRQTGEDVLSAYKDYLDQRLKSKDLTSQELNDLTTNGLKIPDSAKKSIIDAGLDPSINLGYAKVLEKFKGGTVAGSQSDLQDLVRSGITNDKNVKKMVILALKKKADDTRLLIDFLAGSGDKKAYKKAKDNLDALNSIILELQSGSNFGVGAVDDLKAGQEQADQAALQMQEAKNNYYKALSPGNAVLAAQLDKQLAQQRLAKAQKDTPEWYEAAKDVANADKAMMDAQEAISAAKDAYAKALAAGNPLAIANIDYNAAVRKYKNALQAGDEAGQQQAQADMVAAQNARRDYYISLAEAQADYDAALVENDPIRAAEAQIAAANRAFANARNDVDRLKAEAQKVRANRQLSQLQHDIVTAQTELMKAWADYAGDNVKSSQLALKEAKDNLAYLQKTNAGEAQIKQAQAQVVNAQAQVRDANLQDKLDTYQFMYDMGKISRGQLIQYLQSLLKIPNLTKKQIQDIQRQIKGLRDELGDNFNIPSDLNLPTLYEVARIDQLKGDTYQSSRGINGVTGGSINNNQQYNIVINANGVSVEQALNVIKQAVTSPARTGNDARVY